MKLEGVEIGRWFVSNEVSRPRKPARRSQSCLISNNYSPCWATFTIGMLRKDKRVRIGSEQKLCETSKKVWEWRRVSVCEGAFARAAPRTTTLPPPPVTAGRAGTLPRAVCSPGSNAMAAHPPRVRVLRSSCERARLGLTNSSRAKCFGRCKTERSRVNAPRG